MEVVRISDKDDKDMKVFDNKGLIISGEQRTNDVLFQCFMSKIHVGPCWLMLVVLFGIQIKQHRNPLNSYFQFTIYVE